MPVHNFSFFILQLAITTSIGQVISSYNLNPKTDPSVFENVGNVLAFAMSVPKSSQLRGKSLEVVDQTLDILEKTRAHESFVNLISNSLDDVIKDLATDAAIKDKARKVKERLHTLNQMECD